jgi:hypothetical protein
MDEKKKPRGLGPPAAKGWMGSSRGGSIDACRRGDFISADRDAYAYAYGP